MTFMEGVLKEAGTAYLSRAPGLTPGIWWGHVADFFIFLCCVYFVFVMCLVCLMLPLSRLSILCVVLCCVYFCLRPVSRVPNVASV